MSTHSIKDWENDHEFSDYEIVNYPDGTFAFIKKDKQEAPTPPVVPAEKPKCPDIWHDWKLYVGFTERYEYCNLCDAKRAVK